MRWISQGRCYGSPPPLAAKAAGGPRENRFENTDRFRTAPEWLVAENADGLAHDPERE
jgi:hypothetical protein